MTSYNLNEQFEAITLTAGGPLALISPADPPVSTLFRTQLGYEQLPC
jgi:hypothetical protein